MVNRLVRRGRGLLASPFRSSTHFLLYYPVRYGHRYFARRFLRLATGFESSRRGG
jgi:hypothetical protein